MKINAGIPVHISLHAIQTMEGETAVSDTESDGVMLDRGGRVLIRYEEYLTEGESQPTTTVMHISDAACEIRRNGDVTGNLRFLPGESVRCQYQAAGLPPLDLEVVTQEYGVEREEESIALILEYDMLVGNGAPIHNRIEMQIEPI